MAKVNAQKCLKIPMEGSPQTAELMATEYRTFDWFLIAVALMEVSTQRSDVPYITNIDITP